MNNGCRFISLNRPYKTRWWFCCCSICSHFFLSLVQSIIGNDRRIAFHPSCVCVCARRAHSKHQGKHHNRAIDTNTHRNTFSTETRKNVEDCIRRYSIFIFAFSPIAFMFSISHCVSIYLGRYNAYLTVFVFLESWNRFRGALFFPNMSHLCVCAVLIVQRSLFSAVL